VCLSFSPSALTSSIFCEFPFLTISSFLGVRFEVNLEISATIQNKGYKHANKKC